MNPLDALPLKAQGAPTPLPASIAIGPAPDLFDQVASLFIDPIGLFHRLREHPRWGRVTILGATLGMAVAAIWCLKVDLDGLLRPMLERAPNVTPSQVEFLIGFQTRFLWPIALLGEGLGGPLGIALSALMAWGLAWALPETAERPTYRQSLSLLATLELVFTVQMLLCGVLAATRPVGATRLEALSPASVGYFVHGATPRMAALLHQINAFTVVHLALLYLGMRTTLRARPLGAALMVALNLVFLAMGILFAR